MSRIVFLLEEYSMKVLLDGLLPRCFPDLAFLCIPHQGKHDLEKSIPRKLKAWNEPGVRFCVIRDNDGADCRALKHRLIELCPHERRADTRVRIACQELEAWYFGDIQALADVYGDRVRRHVADKARFRDPDAIVQPSRALADLTPEFQKVSGARAMSERLNMERNTSGSFRAFLDAVQTLMRSASNGVT
jgi:hypothetical protein